MRTHFFFVVAGFWAGCTTVAPTYEMPGEDTGSTADSSSDAEAGAGNPTTGSDPSSGATCASATCDDGPSPGETSTGESTMGCLPVTWYLDLDGDGFGDPENAIASCDPVGNYDTQQAGDCCDTDPDVHPDQESFFFSPNLCGHYDYNCDGIETPSLTCECVPGQTSLNCSLEPNPNCTIPPCGSQFLSVCQPIGRCGGLAEGHSHGAQTCK